MLKLSNATWGNAHLKVIQELKDAYKMSPNVHITNMRPTPQQPHKTHEVVVTYQNFITSQIDPSIRYYEYLLDVHSSGTEENHNDIVIQISDIITNRYYTKVHNIEVTDIQPFGSEIGDIGNNTGIFITATVRAANLI